jgi:chloramphenicol O-acetyltransferase type A
MRYINLETWPRREHFEVFRTWEYPHFNMCANVDLTAFYPPVKKLGMSINVAIIYVLARTANEIPEFHYRIRGEEVIVHEVVKPSSTFLTDGDIFTFCTFEYDVDFIKFVTKAQAHIANSLENPSVEDPDNDDLLFMTSIPWVSFTSFMHPLKLNPADSVPRFAWGKFFRQGDAMMMPLSVQGHHAVMDGLHVGKFYERLDGYLCNPDFIPGEPHPL